MYRMMMMVVVLSACSVTLHAEPKEAPKVFGHRDANGRMVFSDQEKSGQEVKISEPSVVKDSKLGIKAYKRQTPTDYEKYRVSEEAAARKRDGRVAEAQENESDIRARCERMRDSISYQRYSGSINLQNRYDRECVTNGY